MNILLANKFYYRRGGDCIYMLNLEQILKDHGHKVAIFAMDYPENIETPWQKYFPKNMSKLMAFSRPFGSNEVKQKFNQLLSDFKPDIVHLNNIHTQLSPIIAELAKRKGIKVVWTLHDYKLLCPRYDCLRNGKNICEECFKGNKKFCKTYKCIKNSILASQIGYQEAKMWNMKRLEACTDVFVCPSKFMARKMLQGGFNTEKLTTLYNFIDTTKCQQNSFEKEDYYCFIGRLSHEKGVKTLIASANQLPYKLKIIGNGPLYDELKSIANPNIEFVGFKQWTEIKSLVEKARFSVIPSEWYENNPLSVIEALCLGTPILGANIGGIPELIEEEVTGMTFESKNTIDLTNKIEVMWKHSFNYSQIAHQSQKRYNSENYYNKILEIYKK